MKVYGYCRVSTLDQDNSIQREQIRRHHSTASINEEKASGTTMEGRDTLKLILNVIGKGDKLVVHKLDRLARNMSDLLMIVAQLERQGAHLEVLDQQINTGTASGKAFLQMLGVFAEFETNLRRERQQAGIIKAKAEGKFKGRQPVDKDKVAHALELIERGLSRQKAADKAGISASTLYRHLRQA